jgi:hypothetical protein
MISDEQAQGKQSHAQIHRNEARVLNTLSMAEWRVYTQIKMLCWIEGASTKKTDAYFSSETGLNERSVRRAMSTLENVKLISRETVSILVNGRPKRHRTITLTIAPSSHTDNPVLMEISHTDNPVLMEISHTDNPVLMEISHTDNPVLMEISHTDNPVLMEISHTDAGVLMGSHTDTTVLYHTDNPVQETGPHTDTGVLYHTDRSVLYHTDTDVLSLRIDLEEDITTENIRQENKQREEEEPPVSPSGGSVEDLMLQEQKFVPISQPEGDCEMTQEEIDQDCDELFGPKAPAEESAPKPSVEDVVAEARRRCDKARPYLHRNQYKPKPKPAPVSQAEAKIKVSSNPKLMAAQKQIEQRKADPYNQKYPHNLMSAS